MDARHLGVVFFLFFFSALLFSLLTQVLTVKYPSEVCWRNTHGKEDNTDSSSSGKGEEQEDRAVREGGEGQQGAAGGAGAGGGGDGDGDGCDAEVIVCATNRLSGPGDNAKVNFTFEVGLVRGGGVGRQGTNGGRGCGEFVPVLFPPCGVSSVFLKHASRQGQH